MSYSETFHGTVTGYETFSYPASEHGGMKTVSVTIPVSWTVNVNTTPFDLSVDNASEKVDLLTGAIVGMQTAQCLEIENSSKQISDSIIGGFYGLINHNLSLNKTEEYSKIQSKFAYIVALSKDIQNAHSRMENDLGRMQSHYSKVFAGLDEDLEKRIGELDSIPFKIAKQTKGEILYEPYKSGVAKTLEYMDDASSKTNLLTSARIKKNITKTIKGLSKTLDIYREYNDNMKNAMWTNEDSSAETEYVPIVYFSTNGLSEKKEEQNYYSQEEECSQKIVQAVDEYIKADSTFCCLSEEEMDRINQYFMNMVDDMKNYTDKENEMNQRVCEQIMKLWNNDKQNVTTKKQTK